MRLVPLDWLIVIASIVVSFIPAIVNLVLTRASGLTPICSLDIFAEFHYQGPVRLNAVN